MAQITYSSEIEEMSGELRRGSGLIHRRKHYRDSGLAGGKKELYKREKRDYKRNPMTPGELATVTRFKEASQQVRIIMSDPESDDYKYWLKRFRAQLKKAEPDSPKDKMGYPKKYLRLDNFIRAKLMK